MKQHMEGPIQTVEDYHASLYMFRVKSESVHFPLVALYTAQHLECRGKSISGHVTFQPITCIEKCALNHVCTLKCAINR